MPVLSKRADEHDATARKVSGTSQRERDELRNAVKAPADQAKAPGDLQRLWLRSLTFCIVFGAVVVVAFGTGVPGASLGVTTLLSGGCLLVGALLGFLFGVPRSAQVHQSVPNQPNDAEPDDDDPNRPGRNQYRPNTNLEEVSDWLTKILVGVGLTQLVNAPTKAIAFGHYFGPSLGGGAVGEPFALCVLVYFSVAGFLIAYLWTRLYLGGALAGADADALARVERKLDAQQLQAQRDVAALAAAAQQLQRQSGAEDVPPERLRKVIAEASPTVRAQIFYQATGQRAANWRDPSTKVLMERTIPIFEALIALDVEQKCHENHGQLGFALKDQRTPDWARSLNTLNTAIRMRGDSATQGYYLYEFNRALCRINTDAHFSAGQPSDPETRHDILADLEVVRAAKPGDLLKRTPEIQEWLQRNGSER
jgi:hypothetical protein